MKLLIHGSIFSIVFAGFVASAVTTKPTSQMHADHSLTISHAMPVPACDPGTGCVVSQAMPVPACDPGTGCTL